MRHDFFKASRVKLSRDILIIKAVFHLSTNGVLDLEVLPGPIYAIAHFENGFVCEVRQTNLE